MNELVNPANQDQFTGRVLPPTDWVLLDQDIINRFARLTRDEYFIHVDPQRAAAETPFGGTISHGFLTLSMLAHFGDQFRLNFANSVVDINYGFDRLRFIHPVRAGSRIRGCAAVTRIEQTRADSFTTHYAVKIEIEGVEKPAVIADWLIVTTIDTDN